MNRFMQRNMQFYEEPGAGGGDPLTTNARAAPAPLDTGNTGQHWSEGAAYSAWDADTRTAMAKFATEADAVKAYPELHKKQGTMIAPPDFTGDPAKADANQRDILTKMGLPEKPEGYEFKYPDGFAQENHMSDREKGEFLTWAHQQGLLPGQVQGMVDYMVGRTEAASRTAIPEAIKAASEHVRAACPDDAQDVAQWARQILEEHGGEGALDMVFHTNGQPINGPLCVLLGRIGEQAYGTEPFHQGTQQQQLEHRQNKVALKRRYPNTPDD